MVPARVGRRTHHHAAYTITELMVVVAVLGIIGAVVLNGIGAREWQRRRVNAVAVELNGWMEAVRRAALKGTGCEITLITNTPIRSGGEIARARPVSTAADAVPNTCLSAQPLRILGSNSNDTYTLQADPNTFTFTPRGTARGLGNANQNDLEITITLNGTPPIRCVRLTSPLGVAQVGYNDSGTSGNCLYPGFF